MLLFQHFYLNLQGEFCSGQLFLLFPPPVGIITNILGAEVPRDPWACVRCLLISQIGTTDLSYFWCACNPTGGLKLSTSEPIVDTRPSRSGFTDSFYYLGAHRLATGHSTPFMHGLLRPFIQPVAYRCDSDKPCFRYLLCTIVA